MRWTGREHRQGLIFGRAVPLAVIGTLLVVLVVLGCLGIDTSAEDRPRPARQTYVTFDVRRIDDHERGVTCYICGEGIACVRTEVGEE